MPAKNARRAALGDIAAHLARCGLPLPTGWSQCQGPGCKALRSSSHKRPADLCLKCWSAKRRAEGLNGDHGLGIADRCGPVPLPDAPTAALPGSPAKVAELERRAAAGRQLFHPGDLKAED